MKKTVVLVLLLLVTIGVRAQIVTCGSPFANFGLPVTFCGYVKGTQHGSIGKNSGTILYLCGEFPHQAMTIVLKDTDPPLTTKAPEEFMGKYVCATGTVNTYRGKYFIAVKKKADFTSR